MKNNAKICVNCKFSSGSFGFLECKKPNIQNLVTGEFISHKTYNICEILRMDGFILCRLIKTCGKEGRWFKEKSS